MANERTTKRGCFGEETPRVRGGGPSEWARRAERQHVLVVIDPIVDRRLELDELVVLVLEMHEGEIVELLERLDIDLGESRKLLLRVDAGASAHPTTARLTLPSKMSVVRRRLSRIGEKPGQASKRASS